MNYRTSLAVQWLRFHASNAGGMGSIPDLGIKIPHAMWPSKKKKKGMNELRFTHHINDSHKRIIEWKLLLLLLSCFSRV